MPRRLMSAATARAAGESRVCAIVGSFLFEVLLNVCPDGTFESVAVNAAQVVFAEGIAVRHLSLGASTPIDARGAIAEHPGHGMGTERGHQTEELHAADRLG